MSNLSSTKHGSANPVLAYAKLVLQKIFRVTHLCEKETLGFELKRHSVSEVVNELLESEELDGA